MLMSGKHVKEAKNPLELYFLFQVFGCPGMLNGIGSNVSLDFDMSPQAGSWMKDPLYNPEHVFFIRKSQQTLEVSHFS